MGAELGWIRLAHGRAVARRPVCIDGAGRPLRVPIAVTGRDNQADIWTVPEIDRAAAPQHRGAGHGGGERPSRNGSPFFCRVPGYPYEREPGLQRPEHRLAFGPVDLPGDYCRAGIWADFRPHGKAGSDGRRHGRDNSDLVQFPLGRLRRVADGHAGSAGDFRLFDQLSDDGNGDGRNRAGTEGSAVAMLFTGGAIIGASAPVIAGLVYTSWEFSGLVFYAGSIAGFGALVALVVPIRKALVAGPGP